MQLKYNYLFASVLATSKYSNKHIELQFYDPTIVQAKRIKMRKNRFHCFRTVMSALPPAIQVKNWKLENTNRLINHGGLACCLL